MSRTLTAALVALTVTIVAVCTVIQRRSASEVSVTPTEQRLVQRSVALARALGIDTNACPMTLDASGDVTQIRFADASGQPRARLVWRGPSERPIHLDHNPDASGHDATAPRDEASARSCAARWLKALRLLPDTAPAAAIVPDQHTAQHWSFRVASGDESLFISILRRTGEPILVNVSAPKGIPTR